MCIVEKLISYILTLCELSFSTEIFSDNTITLNMVSCKKNHFYIINFFN